MEFGMLKVGNSIDIQRTDGMFAVSRNCMQVDCRLKRNVQSISRTVKNRCWG